MEMEETNSSATNGHAHNGMPAPAWNTRADWTGARRTTAIRYSFSTAP